MTVSCVYCGLSHDRPSEVRDCWQRSGGGQISQAQVDPRPLDAQPESAAPRAAAILKRGPEQLGRNVIVGAGQDAPEPWQQCKRITLRPDDSNQVDQQLSVLRDAAHAGESLVLELGEPFDPPRAACTDPPYHLGPEFSFPLDDLHHFTFANTIDARDEPRFGVVDQAVLAGAEVANADQPGDIVGSDGTAMWLDGGPVRFFGPVDGVPVLHRATVEHGSLVPPKTNDSAAKLAPDQLAAVTHTGGAARIIAPAGSGKTRVLTERARHLVSQWNLPATAVGLVAFNKRAQTEMQERTGDVARLRVRTLNAISLAIINGEAPFAPQPRRWRTIDEPSVRAIISRLVTVPKRRNTDPLAPWIDALSLLRLGLRSPQEVEAQYGGDVDGLADVWSRYRVGLEREGAVDFDDQIYRAIEVLLTQPAAREAAQLASRVLLVDEFQDLTPAHLLLVRLLAAPGGAVFGVGDDDQTIYGYNGADPQPLIDFSTIFPGAGDHPLEVNYRCPAGIVESVDRLLRHNRRRVPKLIRSASTTSGGFSVSSSDDPVGVSVSAVQRPLADGATPAEVAVLTRVNATIAPVQIALSMAEIPIAGGVGSEFAERTSIRAVLAWLRLSSDNRFAPDDLREALRRPSRPLHPRITDWVAEQRTVAEVVKLAERLNTERDSDRVHSFAADISALRSLRASHADTLKLVTTVVDQFGLATSVSKLDQNRAGMNKAAQSDDLQAIRQIARLRPDVESFEPWLRSQLMASRDPNGVQLTTIHRVKGLEWPHVVIHLADADQFPHRLAQDTEEERRLFHVALTRAQSSATIVSGRSPSPFVAELDTEPPAVLPDEPPPQRRAKPATRTKDRPDHPLLDRTSVMAVPGLVLVDQGVKWTIIEIDPLAAVAKNGSASRRFSLGEMVETAGRQKGALVGRNAEASERAVLVFDRLREFRNDVRGAKPAYTVFDDKTLAAIATAAPTDLVELSAVSGVGPAKLEQYGDAVLAINVEP